MRSGGLVIIAMVKERGDAEGEKGNGQAMKGKDAVEEAERERAGLNHMVSIHLRK